MEEKDRWEKEGIYWGECPASILSTSGARADEINGKKARLFGTVVIEREQPAIKKPSQNDSGNCMNVLYNLNHAGSPIQKDPARQKEIEKEVVRSCQSISSWPLLKEINHWFYDLRTVYEPPERLVSESKLIVLAWKKVQGRVYFPYTVWLASSQSWACFAHLQRSREGRWRSGSIYY